MIFQKFSLLFHHNLKQKKIITMLQLVLIISIGVLAVVVALVAQRKSKSPEKSWVYCLIDVALGPLRLFRLSFYKGGKINVDQIVKDAQKISKLTDYGGLEFVGQYKSIDVISTFHRSQKLTNLGFLAAKMEMTMAFAGRLKKIQYFKENPGIFNVPVRQPVFVTGLPRTGTTFLHRLLSLDPKTRAPLLWELVNSVPMAKITDSDEEKQKCRKKRRDWVAGKLEMRKFLGDDSLTHIHEIGADLPEECFMAMREEVPLLLQHLTSVYMDYDAVRYKLDFKAAYQFYKKILQLMSYQVGETTDPRRWTLKCPMHLSFTKEISSVFPDAKLIWYVVYGIHLLHDHVDVEM